MSPTGDDLQKEKEGIRGGNFIQGSLCSAAASRSSQLVSIILEQRILYKLNAKLDENIHVYDVDLG